MGPKSPTPQTQQLFGYPLDQHLNLKHPLIQLAALIDWSEIRRDSKPRRKAKLRMQNWYSPDGSS
jgi:hypothetical protein